MIDVDANATIDLYTKWHLQYKRDNLESAKLKYPFYIYIYVYVNVI